MRQWTGLGSIMRLMICSDVLDNGQADETASFILPLQRMYAWAALPFSFL